MTRPLWEFIKDLDVDSGKLPLVHSTDLYSFSEIRLESLETSPCNVYNGENLLYFFYGRPSYRPHLTEGSVTAKSFAPVCMVFGHAVAKQAIRIMPFDSGAFHSKRTHPPMHPRMQLSEFELAVDVNAPMKLIKMFYGTESAYLNEKPMAIDTIDDWTDFHVDAYYKLIRMGNNRTIDERISAIELQLDRNVLLAAPLQRL